MSKKGSAFAKGGFGCILAFLAIGLLCVLLGGRMYIDLGGAIILFVIGGIIGLIVLAIYNKGYSEGKVDKGDDRGPHDSSGAGFDQDW
jgi:hypothetical protein